jgi:hypothetical protein
MPTYVLIAQAEAISASTTETLLQLVTPATRRAKIKEWGVSFNGVAATAEPVRVDLLRQTTAGTASAHTPIKTDPAETASLCSAQRTFTAEPTAGDVLWTELYSPAGGFDRPQLPLGEEFIMGVSERVGLRVVVPAGVTGVSATAYIRYEE